jgi:hypothetical protein
MAPPVPAPEEYVGLSHASLTFDGGGLTIWADTGVASAGETQAELRLVLQPDSLVVIGRQQGGEVPYLDPRYTPTHVLPDSGSSILTGIGDGRDTAVSRGHFVLRGSPTGLVLVNGVPRPEGGIRPPRNGTVLLEPEDRPLGPGEEYPIPHGQSATIRLPNGTRVLIHAA